MIMNFSPFGFEILNEHISNDEMDIINTEKEIDYAGFNEPNVLQSTVQSTVL